MDREPTQNNAWCPTHTCLDPSNRSNVVSQPHSNDLPYSLKGERNSTVHSASTHLPLEVVFVFGEQIGGMQDADEMLEDLKAYVEKSSPDGKECSDIVGNLESKGDVNVSQINRKSISTVCVLYHVSFTGMHAPAQETYEVQRQPNLFLASVLMTQALRLSLKSQGCQEGG